MNSLPSNLVCLLMCTTNTSTTVTTTSQSAMNFWRSGPHGLNFFNYLFSLCVYNLVSWSIIWHSGTLSGLYAGPSATRQWCAGQTDLYRCVDSRVLIEKFWFPLSRWRSQSMRFKFSVSFKIWWCSLCSTGEPLASIMWHAASRLRCWITLWRSRSYIKLWILRTLHIFLLSAVILFLSLFA